MRFLILSAYILYLSHHVACNWRNYFKNTDYATKTKSTTKHYKFKAYYTLESLFPTNVTDLIDMDLNQDPDDSDDSYTEHPDAHKWLLGNRTLNNQLAKARVYKAKQEHKKNLKMYKWQKRFNWTYCDVGANKETYGKKPNMHLLYKSLLGGWKHNDLQQYWNVRLPGDGMMKK